MFCKSDFVVPSAPPHESVNTYSSTRTLPRKESRAHDALFVVHVIGSFAHLLGAVVLYFSWRDTEGLCDAARQRASILHLSLVGVYGLATCLKLAIAVRHFVYTSLSHSTHNCLLLTFSSKQFALACIAQVVLQFLLSLPNCGYTKFPVAAVYSSGFCAASLLFNFIFALCSRAFAPQ